jgi:hypothetical protein
VVTSCPPSQRENCATIAILYRESSVVASLRLLAMQKIEGSSPLIRSSEPAGNGGMHHAHTKASAGGSRSATVTELHASVQTRTDSAD